MERFIHYAVIEGETRQELERKVNDLLMRGYRPVGGVCVSAEATDDGIAYRFLYAQAMMT